MSQDSLLEIKNRAYRAALEKDFDLANKSILEYIRKSGDLEFIYQDEFLVLKDSVKFRSILEHYKPRFNIWTFFCIVSSIIGLFIAVVLNISEKKKKSANLLLGLFILFHSILIGHIALYFSNYVYKAPHSLFFSTTFSFLYGPLLYFYFKKTTTHYAFQTKDLMHLLPSLALLIYIFPYYALSENEKLLVLLNNDRYILPGASVIFATKAISLLVYAILIQRLHNKQTKNNNLWQLWQIRLKNYYWVYWGIYVIYGLSLLRIIDLPYILHVHAILLASLVMYIAFIAYSKPEWINKEIDEVPAAAIKEYKEDAPIIIKKYKKSGLTVDFSNELRAQLLYLLDEEKIYRVNNITLEMLSNKLNTSRHNTSQVINEHFQMNFFELINFYRIEEAKSILESDQHHKLHIIDIAYKIGYNNKVTFNKSFKKLTKLTPTQYIEKMKVKQKDKLHRLAIAEMDGNMFPSGSSN